MNQTEFKKILSTFKRKGVLLKDIDRMTKKQKGVFFKSINKPWTKEELDYVKEKRNKKIREFERRYEMSSDKMEKMVQSGKMKETHEICQWLMELRIGELYV
jgi:hypothetical protein